MKGFFQCTLFFVFLVFEIKNEYLHFPNFSIEREVNSTSSKCIQTLETYLNGFLTYQNLPDAISNSGKGLNDLGLYYECTQRNDSVYLLLTVKNLLLTINLGICSPIECQPENYNRLRKPLVKQIKKLISIISDIKGEDVPLNESDIEFLDVIKYRKERKYNYFGFKFMIISFSIFIFLNIFGTIYRSVIDTTDYSQIKPIPPAKIYIPPLLPILAESFHLKSNLTFLASTKSRESNDTKVFNGLRVICMAWVVLVHSVYYLKTASIINPIETQSIFLKFQYSFFTNGTVSVDVFLFLSGFLACYILIKAMSDNRFKVNISYYYIHRVLRILPMYVACYLLYAYAFPQLLSGVVNQDYYHQADVDCPQNILSHFGFFNNFVNFKLNCMGWTWYLAVDMQYFIITPIIIYIYLKSKKWAYIVMGIIGLGCTIALTILSLHFHLSLSFLKYDDNFYKYYYDKPYNRILTYFIGCILGMSYFSYKGGEENWVAHLAKFINKSAVIRLILYIIGLNLMFWVLHLIYWLNNYPDAWNKYYDTIYIVLSRPLFVIGLMLLVFPMMLQHLQWLANILGHNSFILFGKLAYGVYLIHPAIVQVMGCSEEKGFYLNMNDRWIWFFGILVEASLITFVLTLFIECPLINLDRFLIRPLLASPSKEDKNNSTKSVKEKDPEEARLLVNTNKV